MSPKIMPRRAVPKIPKAKRLPFTEFKSSLIPSRNSMGDFLLIKNRANMAWLFDEANWRSRPKRMSTEHFGGHKGTRRNASFQVRAKKPGTSLTRTLILKPALTPNQRLQELYGLERFGQEARVVTETPIGLCRHKGTWYTVTLKEPGKTLMKIGRSANGSVVDAAKILGRAYNAGLVHGDMGPKHFLASGKRLRMFDMEFARRAMGRKDAMGDFEAFFVLSVEDKLISTRAKALQTINAFAETTGLDRRQIVAGMRRAILKRQKIREEFNIKPPLMARVLGKEYDPLERMLSELK